MVKTIWITSYYRHTYSGRAVECWEPMLFFVLDQPNN